MKLGMTGLIEPKTVQQVGKFSGASYVLVGTIQKVGKDVQVNSRLVRTETSKVEKSVETKLKASPKILELLFQEITTPLIPIPEDKEQKLLLTDFDKLRKDYEKLQDELENLKQQMAQAKDEKTKQEVQKKQRQTEKELTAHEYFAKGNIAYDLKDFVSAIENYNRAIEIDTKLASAYYNRGVVYYERGQISAAKRDFQKACDLGHDKAYDVLDKLR